MSFFFTVYIQHFMSGNHRKIDICCSKHSNLLINCDNHFKLWMRDFFGFQNCKRICYGNTIIPAKCCSFCFHEITIYKNIQTIFCKINIATVFLFTDHIHMTLNNNCVCVFISRSSFFYNNHIV